MGEKWATYTYKDGIYTFEDSTQFDMLTQEFQFKEKNKVPKSLDNVLFLLKNSILFDLPLNETFESINYYSIAFGINFIPYENIEKIYDDNIMFVYEEYNKKHKEIFNQLYDRFVDHSLFLKHLGGLND